MNKPIVNLSEYKEEWESQYEYEKSRIMDVLGDEIVGIEHIGSTSIKGLKAKPIIDILVGVRDLITVTNFMRPLNKISFEYVHKPELLDRRFFKKGSLETCTFHLHICEINSKEWEEKLIFRDYLRKHPQMAKQYASLKTELASKYTYDRQTYTKHKEPFIKYIIEKGREDVYFY
ncbi:GrpB family protein [Oceanobacillus kapialis]|uniref:GrpB family protein n=1 Tax=Oceanobacillus kapialis TaxID=481353 RepID=A0ABW5Q1W7_9BACI